MSKAGKDLIRSYKEQISREYKWELIEWDIEIWIKIYFWDKRKRDRDNYHKITMDCLSWSIIKDDVQIIKATVEKWYDKENPRYEIFIKAL